MKITFMTLQKASIVCLGVGMFLALGSAGTFETTGEIQTGVYVAAFVFLLAAGLLMSEEETRERTSAILGRPVSDSAWTEAWEKAKRKIRHIAEFCGYDGCRERPGYMAQLAAEYIREATFSAWTIKRGAAKN